MLFRYFCPITYKSFNNRHIFFQNKTLLYFICVVLETDKKATMMKTAEETLPENKFYPADREESACTNLTSVKNGGG